MRAALVKEYGVPCTWETIRYRAFPSVEALASAGVIGLRECKLSTRKADYILEVARSIHEGYLDLKVYETFKLRNLRLRLWTYEELDTGQLTGSLF